MSCPHGQDDLRIRRLDPADTEAMREFQRVYVEAESLACPGGRLYSAEDGASVIADTAGAFGEGYGAYLGDRMVGELIVFGSTRSNLDRGTLLIWVAPDSARRGVGSRLLAHGEQRLRDRGRRIAQAYAQLGEDGASGYARFAGRHGYRMVQPAVGRQLPLPVDAALLDRLEREALPRAGGYAVRVVDGPIPDELREGYVRLSNRLPIESPSGDVALEDGGRTVEDVIEQDRDLVDSGRRRITALALAGEESGQEVVAFACAVVSAPGNDHVQQWATIVDRAHRGHRLGMLVKIAALRTIQETAPQKRFVATDNAETNEHMIAINEALGFRVISREGEFEKELSEEPGRSAASPPAATIPG